ncbi:hypothetical protein FRX31_029603, partial [Thalictrum thalictroides]
WYQSQVACNGVLWLTRRSSKCNCGSRVGPSNAIVGKLASITCDVENLDPSNLSSKEIVTHSDDVELYFVDNETWATLFRLARRDFKELEETNSLLQDKIEFFESQVNSLTTDLDTYFEVF